MHILVSIIKTQMYILATTRFNTETWQENIEWREKNNHKGCIYGTPKEIGVDITPNIPMFILEMHNDENKVKGIGLIKNALLIKEKIVSETVPRYFPSYYWYGRTYYEQYNKLEYDFFLMNLDGSISEFNGKKNNLFEFMSDNIDEVKEYYIKNNLKIKKMKDLVKVVAYYNSL